MRSYWPLEMGADWRAHEGVYFRIWAPAARSVEVALFRRATETYLPMTPEGDGVFGVLVPEARPGTRYKFRLNGGPCYPDPYSRCQSEGVHGPSVVVDPRRYVWRDVGWQGVGADELVIYECHVGTYTVAGTFDALRAELGELRRLGVTAIELMPVAEFAGHHNWGYDGVDLYAPSARYGGPLGLKRLVDAAHRTGLAVILDVVYNHLGPSGNYLRAFAPQYFTDRYSTPWGEALNYDGHDSRRVRQYVVENACYWLNEYHLDGLRLDATHAIFDSSASHIVREIAERARQSVGDDRNVVIIAEDGNNDVSHIHPVEAGGRGLDAVWADDFHHSARTYLTGERDGYFADFSGELEAVASTIRGGFLYQGQRSAYSGRARGTPVTDEPAEAFVFCIQNHDQVGNRAFGDRLNHVVDRGRYLTASAVLLLAPETPLLFMGQEFAASAPFRYFTDHEPDLGRLVTVGRREEFRRFAAFSDPAMREQIPDPQLAATFLASKLDLTEREQHAGVYRCYRDLVWLRRNDAVFRVPDRQNLRVAVLSDSVLVMHRWRGDEHRLLIANFGGDAVLTELAGATWDDIALDEWQIAWTSNAGEYWEVCRGQPRFVELVEGVADEAESGLFVPRASAVALKVERRPLLRIDDRNR